MANREEILYQDFSDRLKPRMIWPSTQEGTAVRTKTGKPPYKHAPQVKVEKYRPTEAEDNAAGRAHRRRQHRLERGWLPYAKR